MYIILCDVIDVISLCKVNHNINNLRNENIVTSLNQLYHVSQSMKAHNKIDNHCSTIWILKNPILISIYSMKTILNIH